MTEPCGIILAAHGSRHPGAMAALDAFRDSVAAAHPGAVVAVARTVGRKHGNAAAFGGAKQVLDVLGELTAAGCTRGLRYSSDTVMCGLLSISRLMKSRSEPRIKDDTARKNATPSTIPISETSVGRLRLTRWVTAMVS